MSQILRAFSATVDDVDNSDRTIVSKISVGSVDRYNSLILPRGIDLKAYVANPVVLFEHGKDVTRGAVPIGRNVWVKLNNQGNTLIAKTRFAKDDFASMLYDFYREGTMTGWSVRLLQKEQGGAPTREEVRSYPGMDKCDVVYRSTELAEYSACSVPGNSQCTTESELRSMFSEAQLESLSTLVVRGFWTPTEEVKPLIEPIIERMSESDGMASGGALVADDDEDEADEPDDDADDESGVPPKKKKKKTKERSVDDGSDDSDDSIAMSAGDDESKDDDADDEAVTRDGPPDEPRNNIGEWTDGAGGESEESKASRRKSRPSLYDKEGNPKGKPTAKDAAKLEKLQAKYDKSPLYKTPDLKDEKTGEVFSFKVVKNAGYNEDPGEHKYYAKASGSKEGDIDNAGYNSPQKAAKAVDSSYKRMAKELGKAASKSRSAPDDIESDDDLIGEWFDYPEDAVVRSVDEAVSEAIADLAEPVVAEVERSAPEPEPEPVDPLAGLPPLVGRSLEEIARQNSRLIESWMKSNETMIREFEGWVRGEA